MIKKILDIVYEVFLFLRNSREDKKIQKEERKQEQEEIRKIADKGNISDLFRFLNNKKSK
jgi:hypothetical protein